MIIAPNDIENAITVKKTPAGGWRITINWACPTRDLGLQDIVNSDWRFDGPDGALELSDAEISSDFKSTTIKVSGGTLPNFYTVTNTITTDEGDVLEGSFLVQIVKFTYLTQDLCI